MAQKIRKIGPSSSLKPIGSNRLTTECPVFMGQDPRAAPFHARAYHGRGKTVVYQFEQAKGKKESMQAEQEKVRRGMTESAPQARLTLSQARAVP